MTRAEGLGLNPKYGRVLQHRAELRQSSCRPEDIHVLIRLKVPDFLVC